MELNSLIELIKFTCMSVTGSKLDELGIVLLTRCITRSIPSKARVTAIELPKSA